VEIPQHTLHITPVEPHSLAVLDLALRRRWWLRNSNTEMAKLFDDSYPADAESPKELRGGIVRVPEDCEQHMFGRDRAVTQRRGERFGSTLHHVEGRRERDSSRRLERLIAAGPHLAPETLGSDPLDLQGSPGWRVIGKFRQRDQEEVIAGHQASQPLRDGMHAAVNFAWDMWTFSDRSLHRVRMVPLAKKEARRDGPGISHTHTGRYLRNLRTELALRRPIQCCSCWNRSPSKLLHSGGYRAFADEPTGNLDSVTGGEILDLLLDLRRERGMTIPVATHDPLVNSRCDRIVRLRDGRVVEEMDSAPGASPPDVLARISCLDMGR